MNRTGKVIDVFLVGFQSSRRWISWVRSLRDHAHNHKLGCTCMHLLQVLLLHSFGMIQWIVICATCTSTGSVRLVKLLSSFDHTTRSWHRFYAPDKWSKLVFLKLRLLCLTFTSAFYWTSSWLSSVMQTLVATLRDGWLRTGIDYRLGHVMSISNHVCLVVCVKVTRHICHIIDKRRSMISIFPETLKLLILLSHLVGSN